MLDYVTLGYNSVQVRLG